MAIFNATKVTKQGHALISKVLAGQAGFNFNMVQAGDGEFEGDPMNLTELVNHRLDGKIVDVREMGQFTELECVITNQNLTAFMEFREFGIRADDPDLGSILFAYANAEDTPSPMGPFNGVWLHEERFTVRVYTANATNITATIAPSASATEITFINTDTKLTATTVQAAIHELSMLISTHNSMSINGEKGAHGIRLNNGMLEAFDGESWNNTSNIRVRDGALEYFDGETWNDINITAEDLTSHNQDPNAHSALISTLQGQIDEIPGLQENLTAHIQTSNAHNWRMNPDTGEPEWFNPILGSFEGIRKGGGVGMNDPAINPGVNLATLHAFEIAAPPYNGDIWAWIQARIRAGNYTGIGIGDWIQFEAGGNTIVAEVAGIDTYRGSVSPEVPRHIDFISRDLWPNRRQWNLVRYNNTPAGSIPPWRVCDLYAWLNGLQMSVPNGTGADPATIAVDYRTTGLFPQLPAALRNVIVEKVVVAPLRRAAGILLTDCNTFFQANIGNLWVPSEVEVYGRVVWGTPVLSGMGFVQYPIFASNMIKRIKGAGHGGARSVWWLCIPASGSYSAVAIVTGGGLPERTPANGHRYFPVCFRIS